MIPSKSYQEAYEEVAEKYVHQGIDIDTISKDEFAETIDYEITDAMTGKWSLAEIAKVVWLIGVFAQFIGIILWCDVQLFYLEMMQS